MAVIPFRAEYGVPATTTRIETAKLTGRWKVDFSSDSQPAVAIVEKTKDRLWGTFLTTVGDYRYLSVSERGEQVCLSCFDGAHAFLFLARLRSDGKLSGDFWAGGHWHETWIAERDSEAQLPDAFGLTKWQGEALAGLTFPDLDGNDVSLVDRRFAGKVRIIHIFGSWCPNCQDAGKLMTELHGRYSSEGLSVLGLAFELTDDRKRSARQLRLYRQRHHALYPILIAGLSDKAKASKKLPILDRVRSFPTTIFLHRDGRIRAVHTGFAGPATGAEHERLKAKFESIVRELIAESPTG